MPEPILKIEDLKIHFSTAGGILKAVDGVTLEVQKGETLGLVGESGCGKSTLGRAIVQLYRATEGNVFFEGENISQYWCRRFGFFGNWVTSKKMRRLRRRMQVIFQDPYASLNPRMTVEAIVSEPLKTFGVARGDELRRHVQEILKKVGLDPRYIRRYPHEFSGGQRQRIGIARAIALNPDLIVADEPISALDVSIQAQILNLLKSIQKELELTYVFIAHDLAAVRHISDRIAVMYLGKIVEVGATEDIITRPQHPYTKALISAIPVPDPKIEKAKKNQILVGEVPSPINPPKGCRFHTRCPIAEERCRSEVPKLEHKNYSIVSCHLVE